MSLVLVLVTGLILTYSPVKADELEEINKQLDDLQHQLELSVQATKPLEAEVSKLSREIQTIQARVNQAEEQRQLLNASIKEREKELEQQYSLLAERVRSYYKQTRTKSWLRVVLTADSAKTMTRNLTYQEMIVNRDKDVIVKITKEMLKLEEDKKEAEKEAQSLKQIQAKLDKQKAFFEHEIAGAKDWQAKLKNKIAELSVRQQEILAAKTGTFQTTVGEVPSAEDYKASIQGFRDLAPAGSFAVFSFGAPHFKGMSQYGAYGRAKEGQNYEQILKAYYGDVHLETVETNFNIPTTVGSLSFEDKYLMGIAEMPSSWADKGGYEALKAQAVAARSYALAYVGWRMGDRSVKKSICVTEACQVYSSSKASNPGRWGDAVRETRGQILVSNQSGEVVNAWYASTSGGYQESYTSLGHTTPAFWDAKGGRSGWTSQAYEKIAGSPWFYKAWYKDRSGNSCGRDYPWLSGKELADILNTWVVLYKHGVSDDRVTPIGSCWGGNPYSIEELRNKAASLSVGYSQVNSVSVTYANNGVTAQVTFGTDKGSVTVPGLEFKKAFNLRAPGKVALKSGLFNIEKK